MAEPSNPSAQQLPPREDFPLALSFLREDVQGVRQDIHNLRQEMRFDISTVNSRMDEFRRELFQRNDDLSKRLDSRFTLLLTALLTLGGIMVTLSGVIVSILKS